MAMLRKTISRLILQRPAPFPCRWSSTETETLTSVKQPRTEESVLLCNLKGKDSDCNITDILNEYKKEGKTVSRSDIVSLSNYLRDHKNYQSALQLYDWVESNKLKIPNSDKAIRIELLHRTNGLAAAENYFNNLQESEKTNKNYGALLSCYRRAGVLDKGLKTFEKMKVLNYRTTLNYNNMMSFYYSIEQHEKVISLAQEMEEKQITTNIYTYNMLLNSYAALKNLDAVEGVLEKMKSNDVKFNLLTYGNLATIYLNFGLHMKAKTYLEIMETNNKQRNKEFAKASFTRIRLYSEMNDLSGVYGAWESLKSIYPIPNNTCYVIMITALSKMGNLERLEKIYSEWEEQGCDKYDFRVPNVLLEYYINQNMIKKATVLYERMICQENAPNLKSLDLFATLCLKKGEIDLALKYLEMGVNAEEFNNRNWFPADENLKDWFPTDETIKLFLNYFEEKNDADRVEKFVESMKKVNRLDSMVYDFLLSNVKASAVAS